LIIEHLKKINLSSEEEPLLAEILRDLKNREEEISQSLLRASEEDLRRIQQSLATILQKLLDNAISQDTFNEGHAALLMQRVACEEKLNVLRTAQGVHEQIEELVGKLRSISQAFTSGTQEQMRKILDQVFISITTNGSSVINLIPTPLMQLLANRERTKTGWDIIVPGIVKELAGRTIPIV
jgi:hypothetical protein